MTVKDIEDIENWIRNYVFNEASSKGVVIGMSGGKDSLVTAKLCVNALGKNNVLGLIMPNGNMKDIDVAKRSCEILDIRYYILDINNSYNSIIEKVSTIIKNENKTLSTISTFNTPPRLRMASLYAVAGSMEYLVANTSNLSEAMVGYTTKWGDNVGDFSPLANFTKEEVCEIGLLLGLPDELVNKVPEDGLSGQSDEDKLGFSYISLGNYIRKGIKDDKFEKIKKMHKISQHKRMGVVKYKNNLKNHFEEDIR